MVPTIWNQSLVPNGWNQWWITTIPMQVVQPFWIYNLVLYHSIHAKYYYFNFFCRPIFAKLFLKNVLIANISGKNVRSPLYTFRNRRPIDPLCLRPWGRDHCSCGRGVEGCCGRGVEDAVEALGGRSPLSCIVFLVVECINQ